MNSKIFRIVYVKNCKKWKQENMIELKRIEQERSEQNRTSDEIEERGDLMRAHSRQQ